MGSNTFHSPKFVESSHKKPVGRVRRKHQIYSLLSFGLLLISSSVRAQLFELSIDGKTQGYLFGSTHSGLKDVPIQFRRLEHAIADSKFVVMETAEGISTELQEKSLSLDQQTNVHGLAEESVKPCIRQAYDEMVQEGAARPSQNRDFRSVPFLFAHRYLGFSVDKYLPAVDRRGYDRLILEFARKKSLPVASLESAQEKVEIIAGFRSSDSYAILSKLCQLEQNEAAREMFVQFNRDTGHYYVSEDADQLAKNHQAMYTFLGAGDDFIDKFFFDRNRKMANKIEKMTRKIVYRPFFAVGAAHLGGDTGIVKTLIVSGMGVKLIPTQSQQ